MYILRKYTEPVLKIHVQNVQWCTLKFWFSILNFWISMIYFLFYIILHIGFEQYMLIFFIYTVKARYSEPSGSICKIFFLFTVTGVHCNERQLIIKVL